MASQRCRIEHFLVEERARVPPLVAVAAIVVNLCIQCRRTCIGEKLKNSRIGEGPLETAQATIAVHWPERQAFRPQRLGVNGLGEPLIDVLD